MKKGYFSRARPSFIEGVSRIFDFGGTLNMYRSYPVHHSSDAEAIRSDWYSTGHDMYSVMVAHGIQFDLNELDSKETIRKSILEVINGHGTE